ncbi:DUF1120 domain-containing protein [Cupriavidus pauculus]|uniref:DUF1120 domain-containing protein n=1 Tax=Cupriavidus pauculus TaxID=82633 RepID=UPI001EE2BBCD|nr:DUF1120 domain-containing protein [Cupriavidus pauculus]GJG93306.1 DUF1120 domain-containing protein [Cupriavidus pauculus]
MNFRPLTPLLALAGALAALVAPTGPGALASSTAPFRLRADMLPVSCDVSFADNGTVDFGVIRAQDLSESTYTNLDFKRITMTVTCDAAAKVAVSATDGRKGTVAAGVGYFLYWNQNDSSMFGVGAVDGHNVGAYIIYREDTPSADGANVRTIVSDNGGTTWANRNDQTNALIPDTRLHSWAPASGTVQPGSFKSITQVYKINLGINKKSDLPPLTREIPIDGLATFTIQYL